MTDHELAERLLAVVSPGGDEVFESAMRAGEDVIAIAELVEQAAIRRIAVPRDLLEAVRQLADDEEDVDGNFPLDDGDIAALREDIATLTLVVQP